MLPEPKIISRTPDPKLLQQAEDQGLHPILARILASRPNPPDTEIQQMLEPRLNCLDHPLLMRDMDKASKRLALAIKNKEVIGIETDHDCDGQTSHAVLFYNLVHKFSHPDHLLKSYIGHRMIEGYGLSDQVAKRILNDTPRASLIITADNGSADEARIAMLAQAGIDVIVTDHHQLPKEGPPASAFACLNPTRVDCNYPDPYIAGCMVAWLLMTATRLELGMGEKLFDSLDFVAVGTVADCVSMARSKNNRAVVAAGLKLINAKIKPCWRALDTVIKGIATAEDLGFKVGPLLNSDGRLASAFGSVSYLLSEDEKTAREWVSYLQEQNTLRKKIQNDITKQGVDIALEQLQAGKNSLCIFLPEGHAGVHGISASRIKDMFGRPTVFLAPKYQNEQVITGSIRGIEGFDVGLAIEWLHTNTDILIAGGGHHGAGGVTFNQESLAAFAEKFEFAASLQLQDHDLGPVILTDGIIPEEQINLDILETIGQLEPFGREFEPPTFELTGYLSEIRAIGDGSHARLIIQLEAQSIRGVWFNYRPGLVPGDKVHCAYKLKRNDYGGVARCEIQVEWLVRV